MPPLKEFGAVQDISDTEYFLQVTDSGSPVRVRLPGRGPDAALRAEATRLLTGDRADDGPDRAGGADRSGD